VEETVDMSVTPAEFVDCLNSRKHTFHQLRMKLQQLPKLQRADTLLGIFADSSNPEWAFTNQEIAGRLLRDICPPCVRPLNDVLQSIASTWNVSVEQLPFYLRDVFGSEAVVEAADKLAGEYPKNSRESRALETVKWWLKGKSES
jgi:hypothetical protein